MSPIKKEEEKQNYRRKIKKIPPSKTDKSPYKKQPAYPHTKVFEDCQGYFFKKSLHPPEATS
ncbi:hypothetical protein [Acutalibacter caecimuris]|uniref:hypothetical protein n=1 Tax=Acutalibacter caecimuris TaxID=3093657 RepID=UPI002AC901B6|nr:hypothetical protein [Acutalibacter sp. M00118]